VDVYPTRNGTPVTDLASADFEILEDKGSATNRNSSSNVVIRSGGPQDTRREPNTVANRGRRRSTRARGCSCCSSMSLTSKWRPRAIRTPLIEALDRLIGQDDLSSPS
jgi:hypothetical protein